LSVRKANKIFISHSGSDKAFANLVAKRLSEAELDTWVDTKDIWVGSDILRQIGDGLATMDLLILIVSQAALQSGWVEREIAYATMREIDKAETLILPFIVDQTPFSDLPWYIHSRHARRILPDLAGAAVIAEAAKNVLARRMKPQASGSPAPSFARDPKVDQLIRNVEAGDWRAADRAAIEVAKETDENGRNSVFESLLDYQDTDDDDLLWQALPTIESAATLAPSLLSRRQLNRLASHRNFSVRRTAASICHDWAVAFPQLVPIDILLKLAVPDEDWYVEAPAVAALKTLARTVPPVLQIFLTRLGSPNADERNQAAQAIAEIAEQEPELLDAGELQGHFEGLERSGDHGSAEYLSQALDRAKIAKPMSRYKYGI